MKNLPYMLLILFAGLCWPLQAAINGQLRNRSGQPLVAVMVNGGGAVVLAGLVMLLLGVWAGKIHVPSGGQIQSAPWWAFLGGIFSVIVVGAQSTAAVPLGAALLVSLFIAGQALSSMIFDQFGLLGYDHKPITLFRGAGVACLVLGAVFLAANETRAAKPEPVESPDIPVPAPGISEQDGPIEPS